VLVKSESGNELACLQRGESVVLFRAAWNAARTSDEKAVCPSVKRVNCDKTKEKSVQIFIPCERSFSLVS